MAKKDALKTQLQKRTKKPLANTEEIENVTKKVYSKKTTVEKKQEVVEKQEPTQRTTLDIPKSLHLLIKMEAMKDGKSLKNFVLDLVQVELKKRGCL